MNVVCNRCTAEYEFDDALVSRRGTTVKCTNCGHQFRVRHADSDQEQQEDRWLIRKLDGRRLTFTKLRDLQLAIERGLLEEEDMFSRDGMRYRPLESVAELESFFERRTSPRIPPMVTPSGGIAAAPIAARSPTEGTALPLSSPERITAIPPQRKTQAERTVTVDAGAATAFETDIATPNATQAADSVPYEPVQVAMAASAPVNDVADRVTPDMSSPGPMPDKLAAEAAQGVARRQRRRPGPAPEPLPNPLPAARQGSVSANGIAGRFQNMSVKGSTPTPGVEPGSGSYGSISGVLPPAGSIPPPRASGLRWIVGLVVVGGLGLIAGTLGKDYLSQFGAREVDGDARIQAMLDQGQKLLTQGDLEEAKAEYLRASALGERNPAVLAGLLQLETVQADEQWLRLKLLPESDKAGIARTKADLARRLARVNSIVQQSQEAQAERSLGPAWVDALRLNGKIAEARAQLPNLGQLGSEPSVAYTLAALDLADQAPDWGTVSKRLRLAALGEHGLGRAQAALVYSLGREGKLQVAREELTRLEQVRQQHPLAVDLATWLQQLATEQVKPTATAESEDAEPASSRTPKSDTAAVAGRTRAAEPDVAFEGNPLQRARAARHQGNWDLANRLYGHAVQLNPSNVEALTGLGDCARARGSNAAAESHYGAALRVDPRYAPAMLGFADMRWASGSRDEAVAVYRRLLQRGSTVARVAERVAQADGTAPTQPPQTEEAEAAGVDELIEPDVIDTDESTSTYPGTPGPPPVTTSQTDAP